MQTKDEIIAILKADYDKLHERFLRMVDRLTNSAIYAANERLKVPRRVYLEQVQEAANDPGLPEAEREALKNVLSTMMQINRAAKGSATGSYFVKDAEGHLTYCVKLNKLIGPDTIL